MRSHNYDFQFEDIFPKSITKQQGYQEKISSYIYVLMRLHQSSKVPVIVASQNK